ncbi:DUF4304 domain-containing protein [Catellatospora methionotrophica]|uniref:DUF4304 domain-containing protein n=1 Tax=Catellatospora methionotrophica TaxID=121620 RepID=UPI0033D4A5EF
MERLVRRAYLDMIKTILAPPLRERGFVRSHNTFRRIDEYGDATLLDIQGSMGSGINESMFYVNVGVSTSRWLRFREAQFGDARFRSHPTASDAQWHGRLRPPPEHSDDMPWTDRWSIRTVETADLCGAALRQALEHVALTASASWLAYCRRIEQALLERNVDEVVRLCEQRPRRPDTLKGIDQLDRITDAEHFYARWLLDGALP